MSKSNDEAVGGFTYYVSDRQLKAFAALTPDQRLTWLEEMQAFTVAVAPPAAQRNWRRLRRGE